MLLWIPGKVSEINLYCQSALSKQTHYYEQANEAMDISAGKCNDEPPKNNQGITNVYIESRKISVFI